MQRWLAALVAAALLSAPASNAAAQEGSRPFTILAVLPDCALTPAQAASMTAEVQAIWAPLDVRIKWRPSPANEEMTVDWTVAVHVQNRVPAGNRQARQPLGAVVRRQDRIQRVIFVSRVSVQQLLGTAGVWKNDGSFDHLYGRFVGRIIAHELGHLLLDSSHHRSRGLMRERFEARDVLAGSPRPMHD